MRYLTRISSTAMALSLVVGIIYATPPALSDPTITSGTFVSSSVPTVLLPQGTPIQLILSQDLVSGAAKAGDIVNFQVLRPVTVGNQLLIAAGAIAHGKVTVSKKPGMFGAPGKLSFTCESIDVPGGQVLLRSNLEAKSGLSDTDSMVDNQVKSEALSAVTSGGIPSVSPVAVLGLLRGGGNVTVRKGQQLTMYVATDTQVVAPPQAAPGRPSVITLVVNGQTLFILKSGQQITGKLLGFDGVNFQIATASGTQTIASSDVALAKAL